MKVQGILAHAITVPYMYIKFKYQVKILFNTNITFQHHKGLKV